MMTRRPSGRKSTNLSVSLQCSTVFDTAISMLCFRKCLDGTSEHQITSVLEDLNLANRRISNSELGCWAIREVRGRRRKWTCWRQCFFFTFSQTYNFCRFFKKILGKTFTDFHKISLSQTFLNSSQLKNTGWRTNKRLATAVVGLFTTTHQLIEFQILILVLSL